MKEHYTPQDYHQKPHLLYEQQVHRLYYSSINCLQQANHAWLCRLTTSRSGKEEDYFADVVPGGYDSKSHKWLIKYWDEDVEPEYLSVHDILKSLHNSE